MKIDSFGAAVGVCASLAVNACQPKVVFQDGILTISAKPDVRVKPVDPVREDKLRQYKKLKEEGKCYGDTYDPFYDHEFEFYKKDQKPYEHIPADIQGKIHEMCMVINTRCREDSYEERKDLTSAVPLENCSYIDNPALENDEECKDNELIGLGKIDNLILYYKRKNECYRQINDCLQRNMDDASRLFKDDSPDDK